MGVPVALIERMSCSYSLTSTLSLFHLGTQSRQLCGQAGLDVQQHHIAPGVRNAPAVGACSEFLHRNKLLPSGLLCQLVSPRRSGKARVIGRYSSGSARSISSLIYIGRPYASLCERLRRYVRVAIVTTFVHAVAQPMVYPYWLRR